MEIPLKVPEGYPSNRLLQVSIYDPSTRSLLATLDQKLQDGAQKKRADGAGVVEVTFPAIQRIGNFVVEGRLTSETTDEKGARQVLPSPVACSTGFDQPVKARSCRLLMLQVH